MEYNNKKDNIITNNISNNFYLLIIYSILIINVFIQTKNNAFDFYFFFNSQKYL